MTHLLRYILRYLQSYFVAAEPWAAQQKPAHDGDKAPPGWKVHPDLVISQLCLNIVNVQELLIDRKFTTCSTLPHSRVTYAQFAIACPPLLQG